MTMHLDATNADLITVEVPTHWYNLAAELDELRESGLYKRERAITTPQSAHVKATAAGAAATLFINDPAPCTSRAGGCGYTPQQS